MTPGPLFAWSIIVLSAAASIGYFAQGDVRHGVYWLAGAVLNVCMTWK